MNRLLPSSPPAPLRFQPHRRPGGFGTPRPLETVSLTPDLLPTVKADDAVGLKLDLERFEALREARPERTSMALPFPDREVALRLQRFDVRSDAFEVAVTGPDGFRSVEPAPGL